MLRAAWLTDIHLNFLNEDEQARFLQTVISHAPDALLITGDIAESPNVVERLRDIERAIRRPIYFVLGNHDFYRGSIGQTREQVATAARNSEHLVYLTAGGVVELSADTALVGHDGWGDGRLGDFYGSTIRLNDFRYIEELQAASRMPWDFDWDGLNSILQQLGDEAAEHLKRTLPQALAGHRRAIVLTHVPPFAEVAWHHGRPCDYDWLPFFACKAVGDLLQQVMQDRPDRELLVLCGHTHEATQATIGDNIHVRAGAAEYCEPAVQEVLEIV